jgi:hypothetical protein
MSKPEFLIKVGKYFREISVIVIGVAVTLFASQWINSRSEKRDINLYLNSIKMELEEIILEIDDEIIFLTEVKAYAFYLASHDKKSIPLDSIRGWDAGSIVTIIRGFVLPTTAFEMFKISGTMRLMEDKELLRSIWTIYNYLGKIQQFSDNFYQEKKDNAQKESERTAEGKPSDIPMYDFFMSHGNDGLLEVFQKASEFIKEIVAELEEREK